MGASAPIAGPVRVGYRGDDLHGQSEPAGKIVDELGGWIGYAVVPIAKPVTSGVYIVHWHAAPADTHRTQGTFEFTVK
jgi:CopC domain-containing protein